MIGLDKVKYFAHQDVLSGKVRYAKDFETIQSIEDYDIGLCGIIETEEGDVLFKIDWAYSGEPIVYEKFMHLKSFLAYYGYRNMRFLDQQSEQYIKGYIQSLER